MLTEEVDTCRSQAESQSGISIHMEKDIQYFL